MLMTTLNFFRRIRPNDPSDPVQNCNVYKTVGCAHVDGMLCSMATCDIEVTLRVTPTSKMQEASRSGRYEGEDQP